MTLLTLILMCSMVAQPKWIGPPASESRGESPAWVWVEGEGERATLENAPAGTVWMGREFEVPVGVVRGDVFVAADNGAEVFLDGRSILATKSWNSTQRTGVELTPGTHVLNVRALNDAGGGRNPAGVIVRLVGSDGGLFHVVTDASWRGQREQWAGWPANPPPATAAPVVVLGPVGAQPWGLAVSSFQAQGACPILRREFTLSTKPTKATIRIIGLGHYELRCNGERIGDTLVNQAWSQYDRTLYWQEFDITPNVREGPNALGVLLGNSFWRVAAANDSGRFTKTDAMPDFSNGREHLLWVEARFASPNGETVVSSDERWYWAEGPLTFSNIFAGEDYDARREQTGWDRHGFDEGLAWKAVEVAPVPPAELAKRIGPGMKAFEVFAPIEVVAIDDDTVTLVYEQNCSALLRFTVRGPAGATVRFRPCEFKQPDGRVKFTYTWGTGKDIWFDYTLRGGGPETHQTLFCFLGAQYVQVDGVVMAGADNPRGLPELLRCELVHVRAACAEVGTFACSDAMQNSAFRLIDWSIRSNMAHFPMDCPHREKCSWLEQDWHMARALSYRFDIKDWYTKLCRDIRDTQLPDGHVPTNSPNYLVGVPPHGFWNEAAEWGIASVLVPWHLYEWYGDEQILRDSYESMKKYVDYLETKAKADGGLLKSNLGDWYDYGHGKGDGPSRWTPSEVSAMAVWALGARHTAGAASILAVGADDMRLKELMQDMARLLRMHESIKKAFQEKLYDPATKTVKNNGSCQAGNAAALCARLIPDGDRAEALQRIIEDLERREYQQTCGEVLQVFFVRALAEAGRNDVLHKVYARRDRGGYGFMVDQGLTTLPESWDAKPGTGNSMNHFMLGHLMEWHFAYVAGIRQAEGSVGWKRVVIGPNPGVEQGVTSAEATFQSPRGKIVSRWEVVEGVFTLSVEVPEGVEAEAAMPDGTRRVLKPGRTELECALK